MTKQEFLENLKVIYDCVIDEVDSHKEVFVAEKAAMWQYANMHLPEPPQPTSVDKPFKLSLGGGYKTRDGHNAIVMRITPDEYYAYGAVMLKSGLRETCWRAETGGRVYSKAPKHNSYDIISRETI